MDGDGCRCTTEVSIAAHRRLHQRATPPQQFFPTYLIFAGKVRSVVGFMKFHELSRPPRRECSNWGKLTEV